MDMKNLKKLPVQVKNHVVANKAAYAMGTVAALAITLQQANRKAFYAFLEEKGIDPIEFYCPEAYEETHAND
jgi:LPS sulfotransferase NodH